MATDRLLTRCAAKKAARARLETVLRDFPKSTSTQSQARLRLTLLLCLYIVTCCLSLVFVADLDVGRTLARDQRKTDSFAGARRLVLGRDHVGIAPLFYTETSVGLLFASEIKSLLKHAATPRRVDLTGLWQREVSITGAYAYGTERRPGLPGLPDRPGRPDGPV